MNPLISVIVPVYNVEKYLDRCITSIVGQTYKNLEIILVDDGSPDSSGKICDEWARIDQRIVVCHKENGGLSDARNFGTKKAKGEYITYIDSDDYVLPEFIEYLYANLIEYDADISCCDYKSVYDFERKFEFVENKKLDEVRKITGREACFEMFSQDNAIYFVIAPCKLYKYEIVKSFKFPVGRYHEDEATVYKFFYSSKSVSTGNKKMYAYFQNDDSITHNKSAKKMKDIICALQERAEFYKSKEERSLEIATWDSILSTYIYYNFDKFKRFSIEAFVFAKKHWFNGDLTRKEKIKFLLYAVSPRLYKIIMDIIGKVL